MLTLSQDGKELATMMIRVQWVWSEKARLQLQKKEFTKELDRLVETESNLNSEITKAW